ncbi:MAG: maleylpyruvate isomerase family mycothiol-dependent enzyme [Acidimicrobiia bacterium]
MEAIVGALSEQHDELDRLLSGLEAGDWDRLVPDCPGWTVSDVVLHLSQTDEMVVASAEGGFAAAAADLLGDPAEGMQWGTVDDVVALMVARQRGAPGAEVHERWLVASATVRDLLGSADPRRPMPWVVGDIPARTLATTRLAECWIHTRDIARAVGAPLGASGRLWHIARLAWRTIPYSFTRAGIPVPSGPVAAILAAPDGSTWEFTPDEAPATTITGPALDFCLVAGRRLDPAKSQLRGEGADAERVLALVRTYA